MELRPVLIAVCAVVVLQLTWASRETLAEGKSGTLGDLFGVADQVDGDTPGFRDPLVCENVFYSKLGDQWVQAYVAGRTEDAQKIWGKILAKVDTAPSCYILVKKLHARLEADAPDQVSNSSRFGILQYSNALLQATQKCLGPNHHFVADILAFKATHFDSVKDFETALKLRQQELNVAVKSTGAESELSAHCSLDMAYELAELKRFEESRKLVMHVLKFSQSHNYHGAVADALRLKRELDAAEQRRIHRR